jgi:UDP-N-acetylenolpyruvoylglucosamine reductase
MTERPESVFFLGLGGMGMAPLALYLAEGGCRVQGHDDHMREPVRRWLERRGIGFAPCAELPAGVSRVVYSSAIAAEHPLLRAARARGVGTLRRGEMLAEAVRGRRLIAVVGSHGKTTTTALLIHALRATGQDVGYLLGALFADPETPPARHAETPWVAAEIDESDGTIDGFAPEITVAVNFDWDHADRYRSEAELEAVFLNLFRRTSGLVLIPVGCARLRRLAEAAGRPFRTFGPAGDFNVRVKSDDGAAQELTLNGVFPKQQIQVPLGGEFNAANAAAALAAAQAALGELAPFPFTGYGGVRRRQDVLARREGLTVYADYAHHPTEITALLRSLRARHAGRLVAVFQPHRYTRTRQFAPAFAEALAGADQVLLLPVYAASEAPESGGTTAAIVAAAAARGKLFAEYESFGALEPALARVLREATEETTLVFVGAGDIDEFAAAFSASLAPDFLIPTTTTVTHTADALDWFDVLRPRLHAETLLSRDEPLAPKTTLGVGGPAKYYAEPANAADLARLLTASRAAGVPSFCLGRGSNLIVADAGYKGLVIRLAHAHWGHLRLDGPRLAWAGAGVRLKELCGFAARHGMTGLEFLEGIPGSVGGSLRMNAGAMGGWIFDLVEVVEFATPEGEIRRLPRAEFHAEYRQCTELLGAIATGALFQATGHGAPEDIRKRMEEFSTQRKATQPRERSAGCLFKNPPGGHAGRILDELGLKGRSVGAAEISSIHANFVINRGGATAADALALARLVREEARAKRGVVLEPEVLLLGTTWEEVLS